MNNKLKASCPICGKNLFKANQNAELECNCPKCNSYLTFLFINNGITVMVNSDILTSAQSINLKNEHK